MAAKKTIFNHNLYAGNPKDLVLKNSALLRGASHGTQMRSGGIIENNLFAQNSISILFVSRNENPRVVGNVVLNGTDISTQEGRGWGIEIQDGGNTVDLSGNILSNCKGTFCQNFNGDLSNTDMRDNIIYKWAGTQPLSKGDYFDPERNLASFFRCQ